MGRQRSIGISIIFLVILMALPLLSVLVNEVNGSPQTRTDPRYDSLVVIHESSTRFRSGGITQWGAYGFGIINRTTIIETRLMNTNNAPINGIEVNLTMYWYEGHEGFSFDKGRVMHRDSTYASVGAGEGTLSSLITFNWIPLFAGSYVMNISIKVPGDPRPFSNRSLAAGIQYRTPTRKITDGLWIGTNSWNCSSMDGWTAYSDHGEPGIQWHVSNHSLSKGYGPIHTPDESFWVGYDGTGLSPTTGSYSLVSPILNLSRFNPEGWDYYLKERSPQIYLLYKYRGYISEESPSGGGGIYHWIRSREEGIWGNWQPLLGPKGHWVNLTGNTTNVIWDISKRPYIHGDIDFIGVDLGDHQGKEVQIRFEYLPSGISETGYVIDDIIIIGKQTVDVAPFTIIADTDKQIEADPGSRIDLEVQLVSKLSSTDEEVFVRLEAVDCTDFLKLCRDVNIQPGIVELPKDDKDPIPINVSINLPSSSPSGEGWIKLRAMGGGMVKDIIFHFNVRSNRNLELKVTGDVSGPIIYGEPRSINVHVQNLGNIGEDVHLAFLTNDEIQMQGELGRNHLDPDETYNVDVSFTISAQANSGNKTGFILLSSTQIPLDALEKIDSGNIHPDWNVFKLSYHIKQKFEIDLIAPSSGSTYREIEEPKENGTEDIDYHIVVRNLGNGVDQVAFSSPGWIEREDMLLLLPDNLTIEPGATHFVKVTIRINYPVPLGIYDLTIVAHSSGFEDESDNAVDITLSIGKAPVSSGIYLLNGSMIVRPTDIVLGQGAIVFFTVRSFGFLESEGFNVNLLLNDKQVLTKWFDITQYQDRDCEISVLSKHFEDPASYTLNISLSEGRDLGPGNPGLVLSMSTVVDVGFIDLGVVEINLIKSGDRVEEGTIKPGEYDVEVMIENMGNSTAPLAMVILTIFDPEDPKEWNLTLNITDLSPNMTRELVFKNVLFESDKTYQLSVSVENMGRWKDIDPIDDLVPINLEVGSIPPEVPIWRDPLWGIAGFGLIFMIMVAILFYLIRRKL